jgi:hypothetical protein
MTFTSNLDQILHRDIPSNSLSSFYQALSREELQRHLDAMVQQGPDIELRKEYGSLSDDELASHVNEAARATLLDPLVVSQPMSPNVRPWGAEEITDPAQIISKMHPEFVKHAADLKVEFSSAHAGRELEEMKKYFGQGSGVYLVTVDFQTARSEAFRLDDKAQKKITKALKPAKKRTKPAKKRTKPAKKKTKR